MNNKEIDAIRLEILNAIEKISSPLAIISLLKLANEFYSLEERKSLYEEYEELRECAKQERMKMPSKNDNQDISTNDTGFDFEVLKQANKNIKDFYNEHPIIANIVNKKNALT